MTHSTRKFIFLINPIAGVVKKKTVGDEIIKLFTSKKIFFEVIETNEMGEYDFLKEKILTKKITDIIIIGGDGTINHVINSLRNEPVQFGIIPLGSGNGLAFAAGIPKNFKKAIDIIILGKAQTVDAFLINHKFSCMLSGVGFDAAVAHDFAMQKKRGFKTYFQKTVQHYFKDNAYFFKISSADFAFETEAYFISIANGNQFGNNFTIAPKARLDDGLIDVVIVQKMNKLKLLSEIFKQMNGKNILQKQHTIKKNKSIIYFQTDKLIIENKSLAPMHIDGDPGETSTKIKVEIIKNCFKLIMP